MALESGMALSELSEIDTDRKLSAFRACGTDEMLCILYQEVLELRAYVSDLEKKASVMTSPEGMQQMVQTMMGGMF